MLKNCQTKTQVIEISTRPIYCKNSKGLISSSENAKYKPIINNAATITVLNAHLKSFAKSAIAKNIITKSNAVSQENIIFIFQYINYLYSTIQ